MRGMLSFHVLWILSKGQMNGQEIAKKIGEKKGHIPTAGTIYPALKHMEEGGMIKGKKKGNTTTYKLTAEGKRTLKIAAKHFYEAFGEIVQDYKKNRI